jgi:gamma-glutamylputrescine oxidase
MAHARLSSSIMSSLWLSLVNSESFPPPVMPPHDVEVIVIGGGLMGISTTYWLARSGANVVLLEAYRIGWGATGRNAGLMLSGTGALEDPGLVQTVLQEEGIDADYAVPGHLALASSQEIWEKIRHEAAQRKITSKPIHALDHAGCEDLLGMRVNARFLGGRWMPQAGLIHPTRFTYGLAAAALRHGAYLATQTPVIKVVPIVSQDRLEVWTAQGRIRARHLVFACSTQVAHFVPLLQDIITPVRGQVMATEPLPLIFKMGMAVDWGTLYWRQTPEGFIILGGYRNLDPASEVGPDVAVNERIHTALASFLNNAFPDCPPIRVSQRWAGLMDQVKDDKPLIGALPHAPNQWIIAGFGGHGLPVGLGAGQALAKAIVTGHTPAVLDSFAPARFNKD